MPAIITHDFFGRDVYDGLFQTIGGSRDEADAFLLGNQGPDPLFYAAVNPIIAGYHKLGQTMHHAKTPELLAAFKESLCVLTDGEKSIGRAYALGFLCHYALDSTMHPFVYCHQYALCDAGEPGLTRDDGNEVHGVIESEFDEMVLFTKRGETIATFNPSREILHANRTVLGIISKMYVYVALNVYGEIVPEKLFAQAVGAFRFTQHVFYSPTGIKREAIGNVERLVRSHSFYQSMSHRAVEVPTSVFDNADHDSWTNPFTGDVRTTSFWDLFNHAQDVAKGAIAAFDAEGFGLTAAHKLAGDLDFSGRPADDEGAEEAATPAAPADATPAAAASPAGPTPVTNGADASAVAAATGQQPASAVVPDAPASAIK
jgi:hypothetical protein